MSLVHCRHAASELRTHGTFPVLGRHGRFLGHVDPVLSAEHIDVGRELRPLLPAVGARWDIAQLLGPVGLLGRDRRSAFL